MRRIIGLLCCISIGLNLDAQDLDYVKKHATALADRSFAGRGYVEDGVGRAAIYLKDEFERLGLEPIQGEYLQTFSHPINTFPNRMMIRSGKLSLTPGEDFIIDPASAGLSGCFKTYHIDGNKTLPIIESLVDSKKTRGKVLVLDASEVVDAKRKTVLKSYRKQLISHFPIVEINTDKFTWGASTEARNQTLIFSHSKELIKKKRLEIDINSVYVNDFNSSNVFGMVKGTQYPDSFVVFSAHYDHLGMMGSQACFNGANDNASGTAVMMSLAKHYVENPAPFSCLFIAFAGEEAGLLGSGYYVGLDPSIPLEKMRFLINLDLFASGVDGITVVNATKVPKEYNLLLTINEELSLLPLIKKRGPAANSDHHYFSEAGVPAIFIYALGGNPAYHDIHDTAEKLTFEAYPDIFRLLTEFVKRL